MAASSQTEFQTPVLARLQAFTVAVLLSRVIIGWIIPCGKNSFNLLKSTGFPENWEGLLFVMHYNLSALDGSWDEILRVTLRIPCVLCQQGKGRMMPGSILH